MDKIVAIQAFKTLVLRDIQYLYRRVDRAWSSPIAQALRDLRQCGGRAVFFGGAIRSLLISRLLYGRLGRPRDLDIVVDKISMGRLRERFFSDIVRENRFGGIHFRRAAWDFDIWPLKHTWAYLRDSVDIPTFEGLPGTTFFNLEAVAVEVWPEDGMSRSIFSGCDQFFEGVFSRTLEINREDNPFPALCIARALVMARGMDLSVGPRLLRYLSENIGSIPNDELCSVQVKHYGKVRVSPLLARQWVDYMTNCRCEHPRLPLKRQQVFWQESVDTWPRLYDVLTRRHESCRG